jgi:cob(I)alamin adenosyltransferase
VKPEKDPPRPISRDNYYTTQTGDEGQTSLGDGTRVPKDHLLVESYGTVDELCSLLGITRSLNKESATECCLEWVQHKLYNITSDLSNPPPTFERPSAITREDIETLELFMSEILRHTQRYNHFVIPGGSLISSWMHFARTVCRRAERLVIRASHNYCIDRNTVKFLNRLSDLLFALAVESNKREGYPEIFWNPNLTKKTTVVPIPPVPDNWEDKNPHYPKKPGLD